MSGYGARMANAHVYPNSKVNAVVYGTSATAEFTDDDWLDLALAALDQASNVSKRDYLIVESMLARSREADPDGHATDDAANMRLGL